MNKIKFNLHSIAFITIISVYFTFMLNIKFWLFCWSNMEINSFSMIVFAFSLPFLIFISLFWFFSLIVLPRIGKPLIILFLLLSAASDYALQNLGIVINAEMIRNFVETNSREAADLVTLPAICYVLILGGIPAFLVSQTTIVFSSLKKELKQRLVCFLIGLLSVGLLASMSYKEFVSFGRNNRMMRYYVNTFNYIYAVGRYYKRSLNAKREFVILDNAPQRRTDKMEKPRVVVLIVGETARANNFSLYGYERETNPMLSQNSEIITFKNVTSCGTSTAVSLPCLFSHLSRKYFDVTTAFYTQNLLDIIKASGYDVFWKDNDDGCKKVCNRVTYTDVRKGNKQPYCFGNYCQDDILLDGLSEQIDNITNDTVIVLHTMGSHGPTYFKRYPNKFKQFTPSCDTADLQKCTQEEIVNTYDNTIIYTDYLIDSVINILRDKHNIQSGMLYISDHGESLGENNIYLHGLPYAIAPKEQKKIPMILWISPEMQTTLEINKTCLKQEADNGIFSHDNYFHSVLHLLSIKTEVYDSKLDIFDKCSNKNAEEKNIFKD